MSKEIKVLLLIEESGMWHRMVREALVGHGIEILSACSAEKARRIFIDRPDIDVIVVSDCIAGRELDTLELVVELRVGFTGRMIAFSSNCNNGSELIRVGCDEQTCKSHLAQCLLKTASAV